ncbi:MAG: efflux RND transporter periplasmic adaptor subunit [Akkermansiaceae bacterium]|nr:efflux RND transporter periplasmic adaptor subunit [Akkermansiaceae bacterium]
MKLFLKLAIPIAFIILAFLFVKVLISKKRPDVTRVAEVIAPQVDVLDVDVNNHQPPVLTYGTVQSYFETTLTPQLSGQITEVAPAFRVGNMVKKKALLARIDATDYLAVLARESSNLTNARRALVEEEIKAKQAAQDWTASGRDLSSASDFVLRKPQLKAARASIESAIAAETKAKADIERTMIRAPYDAVVIKRSASVGNYASPQQALGKLIATEKVEVRLPLTAEQVAIVQLPRILEATSNQNPDQQKVVFTSATKEGAEWQGELVRIEPSIDPKNQVAYVIAEIEKPYHAEPEPLVVGSFVNARIPGRVIDQSYKIPEAALVNDAYVWVVDEGNKLCRVDAQRVYGHATNVYLRISDQVLEGFGLKSPLRIVIRPLATFKHGREVDPMSVSSKL